MIIPSYTVFKATNSFVQNKIANLKPDENLLIEKTLFSDISIIFIFCFILLLFYFLHKINGTRNID